MDLRLHPFTLRQLQYAVAVADAASFRKAAERCHVSQPSLSAQLAQLEGALGFRLFDRDRGGVLETAAGGAFLARARLLLREAGDLHETARKAADPFAGVLRIGLIPTIAPYLLPEVAPALRARYPRLAFAWTEDKTAVLAAKIASGELDAAILALEARLGDLAHAVVGRDPFVLAVSKDHRLARVKGPAKLRDLEGERVLLLDDGHCFRDQALAVCGKAQAEEAGYRATSLPTLVQMAAGGEGVTLLPRMAVPVENRGGTLHVRPFAPPAPSRTIVLAWRKSAARDATLQALGDTLRSAYPETGARRVR